MWTTRLLTRGKSVGIVSKMVQISLARRVNIGNETLNVWIEVKSCQIRGLLNPNVGVKLRCRNLDEAC